MTETPLIRREVAMTLPARLYRDPVEILIAKESAIENRLKGCKGCKLLSFDASGERIIAVCERKRKVGRKGRCTFYRESD